MRFVKRTVSTGDNTCQDIIVLQECIQQHMYENGLVSSTQDVWIDVPTVEEE